MILYFVTRWQKRKGENESSEGIWRIWKRKNKDFLVYVKKSDESIELNRVPNVLQMEGSAYGFAQIGIFTYLLCI